VLSRRLAVEVDGPTHYCRNALPGSTAGGGSTGSGSSAGLPKGNERIEPLGASLLKRRLLQQQGWTVVSVNAAAWEGLRGAAQKRAFLAAAVAAAEAGSLQGR